MRCNRRSQCLLCKPSPYHTAVRHASNSHNILFLFLPLQAKKGRLIGEDSDDESSALAAAKTEKAKKQKALKIKVDGASKAMKDAGAKKIVYDDDGECSLGGLMFRGRGRENSGRDSERERERLGEVQR